MSVTGKEYKLAIRIAGVIDKSFSTSLVAANSTLRKTVSAVDKDFTKLDKGFNAIMGFGSKAFHAIATAATVAATAIGAATVAAINVGMEFEKQMSAVQAISGATAEELAQLEDKARELGQTSVFSATEVGKAMEYMGMAGWKTEQILAGIEGVMNLAAASGEDLATVSDIVTDDLTAFHMEAEETARMVDVMAQAAMNSNTNVQMMGETFKYAGTVAGAMGYNIEDMAIATGLMASSGIKASNAGTALRNIITRMAKPTKESAEAMEALGLSLERDDGSMYSFLEIMEQMREGMSGMTEVQKAYYAAELGGQRGMPGLLAIANSTDRQFEELTEAIYNAEGAAQRMADIRLDNLAGDVQIFKDTLADAGIELSQKLNDPLRSLVQTGTRFINSAAVQIPKAVSRISMEFPTLQRKFKKFAQPVFSGILDGGKWIIKHGKGIISVLVGIGAALAAYKTASSIVHIINAMMLLGSLNPVTLGILGTVSAVGLLTGAYVNYKQQERELIDQNLSKYFGDISLSMEELSKAAEHILSDKNLGLLKEAAEAFGGLEELASAISDNVSALNRMNWKISIGMDLTQDEMGTYRDEIEGFISNCQEYALQQQYAVTLSVRALISDESLEKTNIVDTINTFYADKQAELSRLGSELAAAISDAFSDNLFEVEEMEQVIKLQQQMANIQNALADSEFDAALTTLGYEYSGVDLTPDTMRNLMEELQGQASESTIKYKEALNASMQQAVLMRQEGYFENDSAYQAYTDELYAGYLDNVSRLNASILQFATNTVNDSKIVDDAVGEAWGKLSEAMNPEKLSYYVENYGSEWLVALRNEMLNYYGLREIEDLLYGSLFGDDGLMPDIAAQKDMLEGYAEEYRKMGKEIPQWITEALGKYETLSSLGGNLTEYLMGMMLGTDPELSEFAEKAAEITGDSALQMVTDGIAGAEGATADAVKSMFEESAWGPIKGKILSGIEGVYAWSQESLDEYFAQDLQATADVAITFNPYWRQKETILSSSSMLGGLLKEFSGLNIDQNADGGIIRNKELSWLAEEGPEAVIPLDGSRNAVSLWEKAGQLLGMENRFDDLDLDGGGSTIKIEYKPTLNFYGEAPSKDDLTSALDISQDKFDDHFDRYLKTHSRVSFG